MYEAFTETHVLKFNQEMKMWKSVAQSSSNSEKLPSITTILQKARELYHEYGKTVSVLPGIQALEAIITEKDGKRKS